MIAVRIRHMPPNPDAKTRLRERICHQLDLEHGTAAVDKLLAVAAYCSASIPTIVSAHKADTLGKETDEPLLDWLDSGALSGALRRQAEADATEEASMDIIAVAGVARASARLKNAWQDADDARRDAAWTALRTAIDFLDERYCDRIEHFETLEHLRNFAGPDGPLRFTAHLELSGSKSTVALQRAQWHLSAEGWVLTGYVNASWLSSPESNALTALGAENSILVHYPDEEIEYIRLTERVRFGWRRADGTVDLSFMAASAPTWSPS